MLADMTMIKKLLIALVIISISPDCFAQEQQEEPDELETDRPTQTESTALVKKGETQLETGFLYNYFDDANTSPAYIGRAMVRYGVFKRLELRLLVEDGKNRDVYIEQTVQSTYPLALSAKFLVVEKHAWLPDISLVTYLKLPFTSRSDEQKAYWSPAIIGAFKNKLSQQWELEYNIGTMQEAYEHSWNWLGNVCLQYKATDKLKLFGEYFAQYEHGEEPIHNAAAGASYQFAKNMQLDVAAGSTVNASSPNAFVTIGYSIRFR